MRELVGPAGWPEPAQANGSPHLPYHCPNGREVLVQVWKLGGLPDAPRPPWLTEEALARRALLSATPRPPEEIAHARL